MYRRARKVPKRKDQTGRGGDEEIYNHLLSGGTVIDQGSYNAMNRMAMSAAMAALGLGARGLLYVLSQGVPNWPRNYLFRQILSGIPTVLASAAVASNTVSTQGMPHGAVTIPGLIMLAGMHQMIVNNPYMLTHLRDRLLGAQTSTPAAEEKEEKRQQLESASLHATAERARNSAHIRNDMSTYTPHPNSIGDPPPHLSLEQVRSMENYHGGMNWTRFKESMMAGRGKKFRHKKRARCECH